MAHILGLDEEEAAGVKPALATCLRVYDDAIILPQGHRSSESGAFKNVVMRIDGTEGKLPADAFSPNWFSGVSVLQVPAEVAEPLLRDPRRRAEALKKLVDSIPSEMEGSEVTVGPELDGDEHDRDVEPWTAGFDSPSCCVGLYSAQQSRSPDAGLSGMHRIHNAYFLLCKAGGGLAAQTFHSRLCSALGKGQSLDQVLKEPGASPGPQGLRRVGLAAQRNRGRILEMAAKALGFHGVDTIGDNASPPSAPYRNAIVQINVHTNVLRETQSLNGRAMWQYASGCIDATASQGLVAASNLQEGFVMLTDPNGGYKINLRNSAMNCLPFASMRIANNRDTVMKAADAHKQAISSGDAAHPDAEWVRDRFAWKEPRNAASNVHLEPPALWGTYASEEFVTAFGRELGLSSCRVVRLQPEVVAVAGTEAAKLRAASRHVQKR
ncbi:MAG: hypothetical protein ACKVI4_15570 [Actinomycetales bacterium]